MDFFFSYFSYALQYFYTLDLSFKQCTTIPARSCQVSALVPYFFQSFHLFFIISLWFSEESHCSNILSFFNALQNNKPNPWKSAKNAMKQMFFLRSHPRFEFFFFIPLLKSALSLIKERQKEDRDMKKWCIIADVCVVLYRVILFLLEYFFPLL